MLNMNKIEMEFYSIVELIEGSQRRAKWKHQGTNCPYVVKAQVEKLGCLGECERQTECWSGRWASEFVEFQI